METLEASKRKGSSAYSTVCYGIDGPFSSKFDGKNHELYLATKLVLFQFANRENIQALKMVGNGKSPQLPFGKVT